MDVKPHLKSTEHKDVEGERKDRVKNNAPGPNRHAGVWPAALARSLDVGPETPAAGRSSGDV